MESQYTQGPERTESHGHMPSSGCCAGDRSRDGLLPSGDNSGGQAREGIAGGVNVGTSWCRFCDQGFKTERGANYHEFNSHRPLRIEFGPRPKVVVETIAEVEGTSEGVEQKAEDIDTSSGFGSVQSHAEPVVSTPQPIEESSDSSSDNDEERISKVSQRAIKRRMISSGSSSSDQEGDSSLGRHVATLSQRETDGNEPYEGSRRPQQSIANAEGIVGDSSPQPSTSTSDDGYGHSCRYCSRRFPSTIGRGQHEKKAHPRQYNAAIPIPGVAGRIWSEEEMGLYAREEIRLVKAKTQFLNMKLYEAFKDRPFARDRLAIANLRNHNRKYREILQRLLLEDKRLDEVAGWGELPEADSPGVESNIEEYLEALLKGKVEKTWNDRQLHAIVRSCLDGEDVATPLEEYLQEVSLKRMKKAKRVHNKNVVRRTGTGSTSRGNVGPLLRNGVQASGRNQSQHRGITPVNVRRPDALDASIEPSIVRPHPAKKRRMSNSQKTKLREYALQQTLYLKDRNRLAEAILNGKKVGERVNLPDGVVDAWAAEFEQKSEGISVADMRSFPNFKCNTIAPIRLNEIEGSLKAMEIKAPGPDGVSVPLLRSVPLVVLAKLLNLFLLNKKLPQSLKRSRTVLIPKTDSRSSHSDFRPISVSSVFVRLYHRILAARIGRACHLDIRQRAFIPVDGCLENLAILEAAITSARQNSKSLIVCSLDLTNAFGSVSHEALLESLRLGGAPEHLVDYIRDLYTGFQTTIGNGEDRRTVTINRGVLQGDPLSPILFNLVINQLISLLPEEGGVEIGSKEVKSRIGVEAFADDLVLLSASEAGAHYSLATVEKFCPRWGLRFNPRKCTYMALIANGKLKKVKVVTDLGFKLHGEGLRGVDVGESWKYLGMYFGPEGQTPVDSKLGLYLHRLKASRLKPQQKLFILRVFLIPRLLYQLALSKPYSTKLNKYDRVIRAFLVGGKGILRLPQSIPSAFLYAPVGDGGLGLMSLRTSVPSMIVARYEKLEVSKSPHARAAGLSEVIQGRIATARKFLMQDVDGPVTSAERAQKFHARRLHNSIDGRALQSAKNSRQTHTWVSDGTRMMSGGSFIKALALRIQALPTLSRSRRGYEGHRNCRAGCKRIETQDHVLGSCGRTKLQVSARHNKIVARLADYLRHKKYLVETEKRIEVSRGTHLQPDMIAYRDNIATVIDVQIVGTGWTPNRYHHEKVMKYSDAGLIDYCKGRGAESVEFSALVISTRGILAGRSFAEMRRLGLSISTLKTLVVATLEGCIQTWNTWKSSTACPFTARGNTA
jgi:hypothetical protein